MALEQMRNLLGILAGLLAVGTAGYFYIEGLSVMDAFYLTVTTLSTVGYGDITPKTLPGLRIVILLLAFVLTFLCFDQDQNIVTRSKGDEIILALKFNVVLGVILLLGMFWVAKKANAAKKAEAAEK